MFRRGGVVRAGGWALLAWLTVAAVGSDSRAAERDPDAPATAVSIAPLPAMVESVAVPPSFLGLSQEWPWVSGMTMTPHAIDIIGQLRNDNGPLILRVGGTSYDAGYDRVTRGDSADARMQAEGVAKTFDALETLRDKLGMRFILALTLASRDMELIKRQAEEGRRRLGDAIVAFELGNEPNYYKDLRRDLWPDDGKGLFYRDIVAVFGEAVRTLGDAPCAGPAWGWIGLKPAIMEQYLSAGQGRLGMVTVHYYHSAYHKNPSPDRPNDTPETLLDDRHTREIMAGWVEPQVALARKHRVPLRITESNSISGGGNVGVSDVYAAALWSLDTALEMAAAGVAGIDFHQGSEKYSIFERFTSGTPQAAALAEPPPLHHSCRVRPPFYGLLCFQQAVTAGSRIVKVGHRGPASLKAYHVATESGSRTVLVNKSPDAEARAAVRLPVAGGAASLVRLLAPGNDIRARSGITLAGVNYDEWGARARGEQVIKMVEPAASAAAGHGRTESVFVVTLPPASAVVLTRPARGTP
jgi:hypothetical protein